MWNLVRGDRIIKTNITELEIDAIVNAANKTLLGGGGVDGAIHQKAGKELLEECRKLNGCKTGEAKITKGYNLKAKYIIHTVAPMWLFEKEEERENLLKSCYENSYKLAKEKGIKKIAFPCLGMGAYKVPMDIGTKISIDMALENEKDFEEINLVCFKDEEYESYKMYLDENKK